MTGSAVYARGVPRPDIGAPQPVFQSLYLDPWLNNVGATDLANLAAGRFNVWRNSLPSTELPGGQQITVDGVPFDFPPVGGGRPDNVRCDGQCIEAPRGRYDWLYLLAAAERRVEDEVAVHYGDGGVDFEPLRLSDFWAAPAVFGESPAVVTAAMHYPHHVQPAVPGTIWCQRVPLVRRCELVAVRLPRNLAVHIFAITAQSA